MRSPRPEAWLLALWLLAVPPAGALTRDQVDEVAQSLRDIPTLTGNRTERELRLKQPEDETPQRRPSGSAKWLVDFIAWLNEAGRWGVWMLAATALVLTALRLRGGWSRGGGAPGNERLAPPTHVRDLDIRPETLPEDVGGAAWDLWQAGQVPAAMSLLYRGALSRLVHAHAVPVRASSTEGDCLRLAATRLAPPAQGYLQDLVDCWRETVYAARTPAAERGRRLCEAFADRLPAAAVEASGAAA